MKELKKIRIDFDADIAKPFVFRAGSSDEDVLRQIFIDKDYELNRLARFGDIHSAYHRIIASGQTPLIIDCGANIGASPIWFSKSFPKAQVFALEPEQHNYELLNANCSSYHPDITCENAAISCVDETVFLHDPGEGNWGFCSNLEVGQTFCRRLPVVNGISSMMTKISSLFVTIINCLPVFSSCARTDNFIEKKQTSQRNDNTAPFV